MDAYDPMNTFFVEEYASNGMKVNAPVEEHRVYLRADQQMNLNTVHVPIKPSSIVNGRKTIIMISNYRDSVRCSETLRSIFTSAVTPDNIKISIYDQIYAAENERPCAQQFCELVGEMFCRRSQIVSSQIDAINATGPTAARYETEKVITNEDFCMAIDSHMVFVPDWDEKIMAQWDSVENPNAIISTYPKDIINIASRKVDDTMHIMCLARIEVNIADAMVMYDPASVIKKKDTPKAILVSQLAGGFNFGGCKQAKEVRNDPHTPFLFHGEEYSRAARLWTNGYDFYAPSEDIVFHWYEKRKVVWERDWNERKILTVRI
ncbi:unnamed protein product [Peronospora belbahrii]|uniref:Glycosyltransferase 2-like domain-containing protein n=1 Tax=Peronospora belbahrii TaxID=622444 RepID=A0ABN8D4F5_9STRA|nr:unnamed protein product [Peronospora belbahrii]